MRVFVTFYDDGTYVIDSDDDQLTAKLLANDEFEICLDDAQDIINEVLNEFEEAKQ